MIYLRTKPNDRKSLSSLAINRISLNNILVTFIEEFIDTVRSKPNVSIILICYLFRSADGHHDETYGKINCVVRSDGMVHWIPPAKFRVFCDVDLTNWPFGEHTCSLRLGSWTYDGNSVSMQINQKINVRLVYINNCSFIFLQRDFIFLPLELPHKQCRARIIIFV